MIKGKKKDAKKDGKKSEDSPGTTAKSSLTTLPDLQSESVGEETRAVPEGPDKEPGVKEPPVPRIQEEPLLAQVIIKSYEGEQVGEFFEGEGFVCFEGGNTYKGLFSEGCMNGEGTYTWADGVKYKGTFAKNVLMHNGCYTWNDGSVYEGSIQDGLRHGYGVFRSGTHPISYTGYWCHGKRHGKGMICYDEEQTSWYSGDWVNNVREGWGSRRYRSGNTYEGQWKQNLRHGYGEMKWVTDNQEYTGQWECGVQHGSGIHTWFLDKTEMSQYPLWNEYMGDFVKGERHGRGTFIYANGDIYSGEWVHNKKHGKGMFIFKNGDVFQDEFVNDCPVRCPVLREPAVKAKKQRATSTKRHSATRKITIINSLGRIPLLGSDVVLNISSLLPLLPEGNRKEELEQVELAVLKHISSLRRAYYFYSTFGTSPPDGTHTLTWMQFWKFLKDCGFHLSSRTLADMDRLLRGDRPLEEIHSPHEILLFRTFVSHLVHLAFHIYHEEYKDKVPHLQYCFFEMMARNVLPSACRVQCALYSGEEFTSFAMSYIEKCWEIFEDFCRLRPGPPFELTVKLRQFLWMLDDFKLLSEELTTPRVLGIFVKVGAYLPGIHGNNLELEMVFLDFFEALLECALVYVTEDMILKKEAQDDQKRSSLEIKEFAKDTSVVSLTEHSLSQDQTPGPCEGTKLICQPSLLETLVSFPVPPGENNDVKEDQDSCLEKESSDEAKEDEQKELFSLWICQVETFFTTKFFPAFEHEKVLREKIKENKKEDAELAELRKSQAEELARLIAEKEEEAKRREAALFEEKAKAKKQTSEKYTTWERVLSRVRPQLKQEAQTRELPPKKTGPEGSRA
ncbi:radial spoke head 10 homolog B-like [Chamaea fasciata]|uniref:radial spoke head 10 homolog B-like n=1 Tax=Chamaea fasciata TaxID=190680 RepID=UPI003369F574